MTAAERFAAHAIDIGVADVPATATQRVALFVLG
jgi:hypothetical protein